MSKKTNKHDAEWGMPLRAHLAEVRRRLLTCVAVFMLFFAVCWVYNEWLWQWLTWPLCGVLPHGHKLIFTGPSEAFMVYVKASSLGALCLSWPLFVWNIWRFIVPGLYEPEKATTLIVLSVSTVLFALGVLFGYTLICPAAYRFFLSFEAPLARIPLQLEMRISEYIGFTMRIVWVFGLCFQMPLVMGLLSHWHIVSVHQWKQWLRPIWALIFTLAAVVTPPDVFSMLALAIPLCGLYAITLLFLQVKHRNASNT